MSFRLFVHPASRVSAWAALIAVSTLSVVTAPCAQAAAGEFETEPTLQLADFHALPPTSGTGYRVEPKVPVAGFQGQFIVHTDLGDVKADGVGMLKQRVAEVGPAIELDKLSSSKVFVDALGKSAQNGAKAIGTAVVHPVDTAQAVPAGVGRFFKSIGQGVSSAVASTGEGNTTDAAKDALGINKAKRDLAKNVGVDPYTTNPILSARLGDLANAAFAGGVSLDVVLTVTTGGVATAISVTKTVSGLAWDLPPEDIRERNDKELAAFKIDQAARAKLLDNRWYTPTMALSYVEALKGLGVHEGTTAFTVRAGGALSETEARFFIAQLRMAQKYAKEGDAIVSMAAPGKIGTFKTASGKMFVPAPLDYLSWTEGVKKFVDSENFRGERVVWFTGKASPKAATELREKGWKLRDEVTLD